jgi:ribosome recycling factor
MPYSFATYQTKIAGTLKFIQDELASLRTGRASIQLLDPVKVEAYGSLMKLNEVANVSVPDATLIMITPWDKSLVNAIEKGIQIANLGFNPVVDGQIIRVSIPPLTEERRKEMVKVLAQKIESGKVLLRNIRTETKQDIESQKGQPGVSEDMIKLDLQELEKKVKQVIEQVDKMMADKQKELMTI